MANKIRLIGVEKLTHAGHEIVAQYKEIDGYNIELIEGFSESDNHSQARISAIHNSLHKLVIDGKEVNLDIRSDGGTNIPAYHDSSQPKGLRFLKDALLKPLVVSYAPFLADELEASFGKYAEAEEVEGVEDVFPTTREAPSREQALRVAGDE